MAANGTLTSEPPVAGWYSMGGLRCQMCLFNAAHCGDWDPLGGLDPRRPRPSRSPGAIKAFATFSHHGYGRQCVEEVPHRVKIYFGVPVFLEATARVAFRLLLGT